MTNDEINRRVAEECGWRAVAVYEWDGDVRLPKQYHWDGHKATGLPNYANDLNAIRTAVESLKGRPAKHWSGDASLAYVESLLKITGAHELDYDDCYSPEELLNLSEATARQRCEAFLRAVGKWDDGKAKKRIKAGQTK